VRMVFPSGKPDQRSGSALMSRSSHFERVLEGRLLGRRYVVPSQEHMVEVPNPLYQPYLSFPALCLSQILDLPNLSLNSLNLSLLSPYSIPVKPVGRQSQLSSSRVYDSIDAYAN
jgi:hypothetical protein